MACADRYGLGDAGFPGTASPEGIVPPELRPALVTATGVGPCSAACGDGLDWTCVDRPVWPSPTTMPVTFETQVYDSQTKAPVAGVSVSMCRFADQCNAPLGPPVTSDAQGFVRAPVTPTVLEGLGADTFAQLTLTGYLPSLYFLGYPVTGPVAPIGEPLVEIIPSGSLTPDVDPSLGIVQIGVYDCVGVAAAGVTFSISSMGPKTAPFYWEDTSTMSKTLTATTNAGAVLGGGFINVPPGNDVTVTATPVTLNKPSAQAHVIVRAGALTDVFLFPGTQAPN
jgi:hypothetical protein